MEEKDEVIRNEGTEQTDIRNDSSQERTKQNDDMVQDRQASEKAGQEKSGQEPQEHDRQGEAFEEEGSDPGEEAQDRGEEAQPNGEADGEEAGNGGAEATTASEDCQTAVRDRASDTGAADPNTGTERASVNTQQYSCSYTPPYYVPNFTVVDPAPAAEPLKKKKKGSRRVALVVLCVSLCAVVALLVGGLAGYFSARFFDRADVPGASDTAVQVTKNDGSITVNEIVGSTGYDHLSVAEVVQYVADSVVEITTSQVQYNPFYGNYVTGGAGSGVIIDAGGFIITNNHVIDGATTITVRLTSGAEYTAKLIGGDADSDIAVLKIEATELKAAVLGKSDQLKVGQEVVAIGNPLGELGGTVTNGIISAKDRQVIVDGYPMTLLQTNAAINPGNSGGGLFNMAGELIGVVNAKQSSSGIEGLGFAIPIDVAWQKASDLMQYGMVTGKVILDFSIEQYTSEFRLQESNSWFSPTYTFPAGVYVTATENSSLRRYDRLVSINGYSINHESDFYQVVSSLKKGDEMKLVISRLNTNTNRFEEMTVTLTVKVTEPTA